MKSSFVLLVISGAVVAQIFDRDFEKEVAPGKYEDYSITMPYRTYAASVKGNNSVKVSFLGGVRNNQQTYAGQAVVDFAKPKIKIEVKVVLPTLDNITVLCESLATCMIGISLYILVFGLV